MTIKKNADNTDIGSRKPVTVDDKKRILAGATTEAVPVALISRKDRGCSCRKHIEPACRPEDLMVEDGIVDVTGRHPVVLQKVTSGYRIVCGHRRFAAIADRGDIKEVRCRVLKNSPDHDARLVAARADLSHGERLKDPERKLCFWMERAARDEAGYTQLSDRAYAKIYRVVPTTIGNWRREAEGEANPATPREPGVQNGHPASDDRARSASDAVEEKQPDHADRPAGSGQADPKEASETDRTGGPEEVAPPVCPGEAVAELRAAVRILKEVEPAAFTSEQLDEVASIAKELASFTQVERVSGGVAA